MARGVNKVILVGNLGADPETRSMPSGMTVTQHRRIATSESWKDKSSGAQQERHRMAQHRHYSAGWEKSPPSICARVRRCSSRENCAPANGRTRPATTVSPPRSLRTICRCSGRGAAVRGRVAAVAVAVAGAERGGASAPPRDDYDQSPAPAGGKEDFDDDCSASQARTSSRPSTRSSSNCPCCWRACPRRCMSISWRTVPG